MAESSRKMQELRAQIQVISILAAAQMPMMNTPCFHVHVWYFFCILFFLSGSTETSRPPEEDGWAWRWLLFQISLFSLYDHFYVYPDLDEASRAELDAIQGNLAKLKGRKGLDDLDVDEWVDKNKRVKAVTIIFYETSLWGRFITSIKWTLI